MSVTRLRKRSSAVLTLCTTRFSPQGSCRRTQKSRSVPAASNSGIISPIRMEKILAIRQQLAEGRYDFDVRLDVVVVRLLKELNT